MPRLSERGLTLTEITIVMVLASMVMIGLVGFYVSSQSSWMDASAQAISQREASALLQNIADKVRVSGKAIATSLSADGLQTQIELFDKDGTTAQYAFWWDPADSLVHEGPNTGTDLGASVTSKVEKFQCISSGSLVRISLALRSPQGQRVEIESAAGIINRNPAGP